MATKARLARAHEVLHVSSDDSAPLHAGVRDEELDPIVKVFVCEFVCEARSAQEIAKNIGFLN